jgi:cytochrome c-type biogenesis protein CcmH/NrfG
MNARTSLVVCLLFLTPITKAADSPTAAGQKERVVDALKQDVKNDPTNSELWLHLGFAYRKAGQIDDAQSAFEKAVFLNPKEQDAYYMLGLIYESKHMDTEAKKAWEQYLGSETNPERRAVAEKHIHHVSQ